MNIPDGDYNLTEICREIIDSSYDVLEGYHYNQIKTFVYLSEDGWKNYLEEQYETKSLGETTKLVGDYTNRRGIEKPATLFISEYEPNIQMVLTAETEEAIRQAMLPIFEKSDHLSPMPIMIEDFQRMNETVLSRYEDMRISEFKSLRVPSLTDARIRPDVEDREIEYKGVDGRERLEDFRDEYGVVPTRIKYEHENLSLKIDTSGKFTLLTVNEESFNILFDLLKEIVENVLELRDVARKIKFRKKEVEPGNLKITVPDVTSGEIQFNQNITLMKAENFIKGTKQSKNLDFSFSDVTKQAGSLNFSARVADERRNSQFNVSATEDSMRVVPKQNCSFPSLIDFYLAVLQMLDGSAAMHLYDSQAAG